MMKAYKRSPALRNSSWYKGILNSLMAGPADNNGVFDLLMVRMRRGTEPPPHVHSREDELFYIFSGEMRVFVDGEVFTVNPGEFMFLPRQKPHAFRAISEEIHFMAFLTPGGFHDAIAKMQAPAQRMELPPDGETYADADLTDTMKLLGQYGLRFLTADDIRAEMPEYPL